MKQKEESAEIRYIERELLQETPLMMEIAHALKEDGKEIQLGPYEGKILAGLLKLSPANSVVEIGTLYGYSACWLLEGSHAQTKIWTVENAVENFSKSRSFLSKLQGDNKINSVHSSGAEFLESWDKGGIDFLFLDADKGGYLRYLELALPHLKPGSVVVGDNTFLFGMAAQETPPENYSENTWRSVRKFNEILCGKTGEFTGFMIPTKQGMTVGVKN